MSRADRILREHVPNTDISTGRLRNCECGERPPSWGDYAAHVAQVTAEAIAADIDALRPDAAAASPLTYRVARDDAAQLARGADR